MNKKILGCLLGAAVGDAMAVSYTHLDYADVCSLLFEGEILSTEPVQTFFEDNAFYTTDLRRLIRGM